MCVCKSLCMFCTFGKLSTKQETLVCYNLCKQHSLRAPCDLSKVNVECLSRKLSFSNILRNLATIEADVGSHAEAVLRGRLSRRHHEDICAGQVGKELRRERRTMTPSPPKDRFRQVLDQVAQAMEDQQREERHHHDGNSQEEALVREKRTLWHAFKDFQTNVVRYARCHSLRACCSTYALVLSTKTP